MSTGRYITGLVIGGLAGIAALVLGIMEGFGFGAVGLMYVVAAILCMTIWGSLGIRVFLFIAAWALAVIQFWWNLFCAAGDGNILALILALLLFSIAFSIAGTILGVAIFVGVIIMVFTFPFAIFTTASDLY